MSGHSRWASIKHKKGATDAKRGKIFTKLIKEITVAARIGGGDLAGNSRLRHAVAAAKAANMPGDNVNRAIKKGAGGGEGEHYEEIMYEGYGPGGVAILVQVMTDNKNRTVGELRTVFGKNGGNLGESGCVGWMFAKKGFLVVDAKGKTEDELMELVLDAGADDLKKSEDRFEITTPLENLETVRKKLEDAKLHIVSAELAHLPGNTIQLDEKNARALMRLLELLEDNDDVQKTFSNFDISDEVMAALSRED
jgi:YebC/PmpR family DNA-binding regulatory protein